jgi:glutamate-1-semialdehyde aminotransferase
MGRTEELIAIPVSEYEHLKQCEEALLRGLEQRIQDAELEMQMLQFDTMIKHATPSGSKHI